MIVSDESLGREQHSSHQMKHRRLKESSEAMTSGRQNQGCLRTQGRDSVAH